MTSQPRGDVKLSDVLPKAAVGLCLYRITKREELIGCEAVRFTKGWTAAETTLRRANLSGRVEVGGEIANHFADVLDDSGDIIETVALDAKSYSALKNHWMRCKVDPELRERRTVLQPPGSP